MCDHPNFKIRIALTTNLNFRKDKQTIMYGSLSLRSDERALKIKVEEKIWRELPFDDLVEGTTINALPKQASDL